MNIRIHSVLAISVLSLFAAPAVAEHARTAPPLEVRFQCGNCEPGATRENILNGYTRAAAEAGFTLSQDGAAAATLTVTTHRARARGLVAFGVVGLLAAQSKIAGDLVNGDKAAAISETGFGIDQLGERVGRLAFVELNGAAPATPAPTAGAQAAPGAVAASTSDSIFPGQ